MTVEREVKVVSIGIGREDDFTPEEIEVIDRFAEILPYLTELSLTMNDPLELARVQDVHAQIFHQAIAINLLAEICIIRDQFRDALAKDGQV